MRLVFEPKFQRSEKSIWLARISVCLATLLLLRSAAPGHAVDGQPPKTSIPKIARIASVQIGYSTQDDLEEHWGAGKTIVGGHPNSGRLWRVQGTSWIVQTDGFDYTERGMVIDALTLYEDPKLLCCPDLLVGVPNTRLSKKDLAWCGEISPGMSRDEVMRILKRKSLPITLTLKGCETKAKGFCALTSMPLYPLQTWTVGFSFTNGSLCKLMLTANCKCTPLQTGAQ